MRTFPARFPRETLISGWFPARTPLTSGKNPVKETCRIFPFPRTVKFRPKYCFHLPVLFRPDPAGSTRERAGKRRKKRRFLRDLVTGIIDLSSRVQKKLPFHKSTLSNYASQTYEQILPKLSTVVQNLL